MTEGVYFPVQLIIILKPGIDAVYLYWDECLIIFILNIKSVGGFNPL